MIILAIACILIYKLQDCRAKKIEEQTKQHLGPMHSLMFFVYVQLWQGLTPTHRHRYRETYTTTNKSNKHKNGNKRKTHTHTHPAFREGPNTHKTYTHSHHRQKLTNMSSHIIKQTDT